MNHSKYFLAALLFPIFLLAALVVYKGYKVQTGKKVEVPIEAYDPRDLLSGHFLRFQMALDPEPCSLPEATPSMEQFYCLNSHKFVTPEDFGACEVRLKGTCEHGHFQTGLDRFYVPEEDAKFLETMLRGKKASLLISIDSNGEAVIDDLLVEGESWRKKLPSK